MNGHVDVSPVQANLTVEVREESARGPKGYVEIRSSRHVKTKITVHNLVIRPETNGHTKENIEVQMRYSTMGILSSTTIPLN